MLRIAMSFIVVIPLLLIHPTISASNPGARWAHGAFGAQGAFWAQGALAAQMPSTEITQDSPAATEFRLGITLGGIGLVGLVGEVRGARWGSEVAVSTLRLRDRSMAFAVKRYVGDGSVQGFLGMGLWGLRVRGEEGSGTLVALRAPLGLEGRLGDANALGAELGLNRALRVTRLDPDDNTPPSRRIIPLPGLYHRFAWPR